MDCIWVNLKNVAPPFFKFTVCHLYMYQNVSYSAGKSFFDNFDIFDILTLGLPI